MQTDLDYQCPFSCEAVVTDGQGRVAVRSIVVGPPNPGEVLIEVHASGLCHTDWDMANRPGYPMVLGHEGAGVVRATGLGVDKVKIGDRVVLNWAIPCRQCECCDAGLFPLCEVNSPINGDGSSGHAHPMATRLKGKPIQRAFFLGTMSEYTVVRQEAVEPIAHDIPFEVAAIMGCGVMTGYGSVFNAAKVVPGSSVAVLGCGGIGLNVIQAAQIAGASTIIAIDISEPRLVQAMTFGATNTVLATSDDTEFSAMAKAVKSLTGRGADYAFECTAVPQLGAAPLALVRHGGMAIQVSGIEQTIAFNCELFEWDKVYLNPLYGRCDPIRDFPILQEHYRTGKLALDRMITRRYPMSEIADAFADMLAGRLAKAVLLPRPLQ